MIYRNMPRYVHLSELNNGDTMMVTWESDKLDLFFKQWNKQHSGTQDLRTLATNFICCWHLFADDIIF